MSGAPLGFQDPWEHARLLSDAARNQIIVSLLREHAPGARVLEVGTGTGLMACVAARLGARKVFAVEPTPLWRDARALVRANGLDDVVEVIPGLIQDAPPAEVDLAFSELLNSDPFAEGVLEAMAAAARWLAPEGLLAPSRLRIHGALARPRGTIREMRLAVEEVRRLGTLAGLEVGPLLDVLRRARDYRYFSLSEVPAGPAALLWDLRPGVDIQVEPTRVLLQASEPGPISGVMIWFEADMGGRTIANHPSLQHHWGCMVLAWPEERGLRQGEAITIEFEVVDGKVQSSM